MTFNEGYISKKVMTNSRSSGFMNLYNQDIAVPGYIDKALDLCLDYGAYEKLGLSFKDLMEMDVWVFQRIKKLLKDRKPKEDQIVQQLAKHTVK